MRHRTFHKSFGDSRLIDRVERVDLRVCDLEDSLAFYRDVVGLRVVQRTDGQAELAAGDGPVVLMLDTGGVTKPAVGDATGLFHTAIRVPDRRALGDVLARLSDAGCRVGASDHGVSEALYVDDPDGNGVEVYRDRPADRWPDAEGDVLVPMPTDELDLAELWEAGDGASAIGGTCPAETDIGHVHLQVSDIEVSARFFEEILGLDRTMVIGDSARFYSSNGYHHHLGANTWNSRGGQPVPPDHAGLKRVVLAVEHREELEKLTSRLETHDYPFEPIGNNTLAVRDPDETEFRFVSMGP